MVSMNDSRTALEVAKARLERALARLERTSVEKGALLQQQELEISLAAQLNVALNELEGYVKDSRRCIENAFEAQEDALRFTSSKERRHYAVG